MQQTMAIYGYIAIGGALGACLRFFISQQVLQWFGKGFPFATLLVNVTGSFLLALLYSMIAHDHAEFGLWRTALGIGFLGAFTTFSTFSVDTLLLLQQGLWVKGVLNVFLNVTCCLLAAWVATLLVKPSSMI